MPRRHARRRRSDDRSRPTIMLTRHGHGPLDPHESPPVMLIPLAVLALGALFAGVASAPSSSARAAAFWKGALYFGADNASSKRWRMSGLAALSPTVMIVLGFIVAYYCLYPRSPGPRRGSPTRIPRALPLPAQQVVFRRALRQDLRAAGVRARPAVLEGRRRRHHRSASGRTASPARVVDVTRRVVKLQTGYHLQLRLRDADRRRRAHHLVSGRGSALMFGFGILSCIVLPAARRRGLHSRAARRGRGDAAATPAGSRS